MQSNIIDLLTKEAELDDIVSSIADLLINDIPFDNYLLAKIQGCDYNYLALLRKGNIESYYKINFQSKYKKVVWCTIELKLAVWLSNYYKNKVTHEPPF